MSISGLQILIDFRGNMSAHQKVGAGKSYNMRLRSIITEGQESNGRFIDMFKTAGQQFVCVMICGCETSCLLLDFSQIWTFMQMVNAA